MPTEFWTKLRALPKFDYYDIAAAHKIMKRDVGIAYIAMRWCCPDGTCGECCDSKECGGNVCSKNFCCGPVRAVVLMVRVPRPAFVDEIYILVALLGLVNRLLSDVK